MRFVREERKRPTNARDAKREEEKKVSQIHRKIWKTNRRFFFLHFFPPLSLFCLCPLSLPFLFEGAREFFVVLCISLCEIEKHPDALLQY